MTTAVHSWSEVGLTSCKKAACESCLNNFYLHFVGSMGAPASDAVVRREHVFLEVVYLCPGCQPCWRCSGEVGAGEVFHTQLSGWLLGPFGFPKRFPNPNLNNDREAA